MIFIMIVVTIIVTIIGIFMAINYLFIYTLSFLLEYWIEHVSFGLLYVMFTVPIMIFYRGVPGFATDCPCVWCRGLTSCPLYVGPPFGNLVKNDSRFVSLT